MRATRSGMLSLQVWKKGIYVYKYLSNRACYIDAYTTRSQFWLAVQHSVKSTASRQFCIIGNCWEGNFEHLHALFAAITCKFTTLNYVNVHQKKSNSQIYCNAYHVAPACKIFVEFQFQFTTRLNSVCIVRLNISKLPKIIVWSLTDIHWELLAV